jgi:hypothetical protein
MAALTRAQAESIIEAGILAPSADNHHLLRFRIGEGGVELWGSAELGAAPFHRRVLALISLGAVVENMVLRAASLGLRTEEVWPAEAASARPLAELRLGPAQARASELEAAIPQRHTNRRVFYRGPALSAEQRRQMDEDVQSVAGVRLLWLDAPEARRPALDLVTLAEAERFRSRSLHEDLFSGIRFDVGWRASATEGLPPGALEIEPPMRPMFKALRHWGWMRVLAALGVHRLIGLRAAYAPCRAAPHLCALATTLHLEHGPIAVGRALERVWLRATHFGLAFQPLAASTLLALEGYQDVDERVRRRLTEGWARICPDALPLMVFRMGHAPPVSIRAGRRPVSDLLASAPLSRGAPSGREAGG